MQVIDADKATNPYPSYKKFSLKTYFIFCYTRELYEISDIYKFGGVLMVY